MRQLITLCSLSALVLLTACGGINASEKSQASSATSTRTSASTSSAVTTATGTSTQLGSVTIDAAGAATVSAGSKLLVTLTPLDQTAAEQRVLVFDLPASAPLTLPNLAAKSYKLSLQIVDPSGKVIAKTESSAVAVTAGVATALKTTLAVAAPASTLKIEPVPVVDPKVGPNPIVNDGQFEFVRDYGCNPQNIPLSCKDGSIATTVSVENERCRAKNPCAIKGESCVFSRMRCPDGSYADGDTESAIVLMSCQPKGTDRIGGMCKSSAQFKRDIHYLTAAERQQLSDAILNTKLSKYYYKAGVTHDKSRQLGFIIEDQPADSIFVNDDRSHVNLYAFTSGAVAAIQELKAELAQQQATIKQLRDELERVKSVKH